jgi:hypothetical protein
MRIKGVVFACALAAFVSLHAASPADEGLRYATDGKLHKPENYRQWVLIGTGLGMAYGPLRTTPSGRPPFTNVFVNPVSYRSFLQSGTWPDKTVFILEVRESIPLNNSATGGNGYFQGEVTGVEAHVKDSARFTGQWAFFSFGAATAGVQIPTTASCYSCHAENAAVDTTFVQFYPQLRELAKQKGTLKKVPDAF